MSQIESMAQADSLFLRDHGLMDYSLLLVIEQSKAAASSRNVFAAQGGNELYHLGIIDFL